MRKKKWRLAKRLRVSRRQVCFAGCRLQVAGRNLIITGKLLALKWNVQAVDLPWLLHDLTWPIYDRTVRLLPPYAKPAEATRGEYIPMILSLQWIIGFEKSSEILSQIAAEFGFFSVSTKMKARWACANIFRRLKSYIISFLYIERRPDAKSGIDGNICGAAIQMALKRFHSSQRVDRYWTTLI